MLWGRRIEDEVKKGDDLARLIEELSRKLNLSVGSEQSGEAAKAEFYRQIDLPFRRWLGELDPQNEQNCGYEYAEKKCEEWHTTAIATARMIADRLMKNLGSAAFVGRVVQGKDKTYYCCAPKAYNSFLYLLFQVYPLKNVDAKQCNDSKK